MADREREHEVLQTVLGSMREEVSKRSEARGVVSVYVAGTKLAQAIGNCDANEGLIQWSVAERIVKRGVRRHVLEE